MFTGIIEAVGTVEYLKNDNLKIKTKNSYYVFGISNRLEQVIANLLDNSISFSQENQTLLEWR